MRALRLPGFGFVKRLPALAARFWRWTVPALITALAVTQWVVERRPYDVYTDTLVGGYSPGLLTGSWVFGFVIASPTMLYYRALIWLGERLGEAASRVLVPALLILGAIVPPWLHDVAVERQIPRREMRKPIPKHFETVALVAGRERGQISCGDDCLRLLFGGIARRVLIVDSYDLVSRPGAAHLVPAITLARQPACPPVATTYRDYTGTIKEPPELLISPSPTGDELSDRALAQIAGGLCPVVEMVDLASADVVLGSANPGRYGTAPQPNGFGVLGGEFAFVDVGQGSKRRRIAQHIVFAHYAKWRTPLAFLPYQWGWLSGRVDTRVEDREYRQKWQWAGLTLPDLPKPAPGSQVRDLNTALAKPATETEAGHLLAQSVLAQMARIGRNDPNLLKRLIADPRVGAEQLAELRQVSKNGDAESIGHLLIERMLQSDDPDEVRKLSYLVHDLPRDSWRPLLPDLRRLAADRTRAGDAGSAFDLFAVGDAADARLFVALFDRDWPPMSLDKVPYEQAEKLREEAYAREKRLQAYLEGFCALADKDPLIRQRLLDVSRTSIPGKYPVNSLSRQIWGTMQGAGIPIERLAAERGIAREGIDDIAQVHVGACPARARTAADDGEARPAPWPVGYPYRHRDNWWFFKWDVLILLAVITAASSLALSIVGLRRR